MIKTLIVENEAKILRSLKKMILEHCPQLNICGIVKERDAAIKMIKEQKPELVFLNTTLPKSNAFELLDKLGPFEFEVVFVTNQEKFSYKAIKYHALDYILTPFTEADVKHAAELAVARIAEKKVSAQLNMVLSSLKSNGMNTHKIAIPTVEGYVFIHMQDIIRCEANGSYTCIHTTKKEKIIASKNIKEYESALPQNLFFRIHNSHLVNINRMLKYNKGRGGTVIMEDGTEIEVASRRRADFLNFFQ
jgi:two-component system LytT family response regulator